MHLNIQHLHKNYDDQTILKDINLSVEDIHSLVIIGPSGSGKTTLLRILSGLEHPDSGSININQIMLQNNEKFLSHWRKNVGVVFQAFNLFPHLNAMQNILLPLIHVHHHRKNEANEIARHYLEQFQLIQHAHKKPAQLSGGQKQRLAIARALAIKPKLIFFDEPTSSLDPELSAEVLDMIQELKKEKVDMILVTHELSFAQNIADYCVFMDQGQIPVHGKTDDFFNNRQHEKLLQFISKINA